MNKGGIRRRRDPEGRMPLTAHLRELRNRVLLSLAGIAVGAIVGWIIFDPISDAMTRPLELINEGGGHAELNFGTVGMGFDLRLKLAVFIGVFISSPWWLLQMWLFIAPALQRREKIHALGFSFAGALFFIGGAIFGWWIIPRAVMILTGFAPDFAVNLFDARAYYRFFIQILFAFGVSFLLPVVMVAVNFIGLIRGKTFIRGWRWAVVGCAIFAALVNPLPDAWSMLGITGPMILMYFAAAGLSMLHDRRKDKKRQAELEHLLEEPA